MKELSLFTGMGGGVYGSMILGWKTIAYVEKDKYCQAIIKQRQQDGWFEKGKIYGDISEFNERNAKKYTGKVDVLTGGFPCQPFSVAGKRKGKSDDRYLFDEIIETIKVIQPRWLFFENVPGLLASNAIIEIYQSLDRLGYKCKSPLVLGSADCGNIHRRERVWIYATHPSGIGCDCRSNYRGTRQVHQAALWEHQENNQERSQFITRFDQNNDFDDSDNRSQRVHGVKSKTVQRKPSLQRRQDIRSIQDLLSRSDIPEPLLWGVDDELPNWKQQLKAIGNGQDPIVMATAWNLLHEYEDSI